MNRKDIINKAYEYIIIGTGPGGATVARELSRVGKSVLMIEKGKRHERGLGFPAGARIMHRHALFSRSKEGVIIGRGITVGGSSFIYNGNVYDPPDWLIDRMGIDFRQEAAELKKEIGVQVLPDRFFEHCRGGTRVREAAEKMGLTFKQQEKFIDPEKCKVGCDWCMFGCAREAKWSSRNFADEAVEYGAEIITSAPVKNILIEKNRATGVVLKNGHRIHGDRIILSAGGVGSAEILLRSGVKNAGSNFFMDPMNIITGYADDISGGAWRELTFSHALGNFEESDRFIIGNVGATYAFINNYLRFNALRKNFFKLPMMKRLTGLFVKLADSPRGTVYKNGKISKPFNEDDIKRIEKGTQISKEILEKSGIRPSTITVTRWIGGHPGGTAAMGQLVDKNFQTGIQDLYICDGSVLPESPGVPPSLIILALSKLLGKMLLGTIRAEDREVKKLVST